MYKITPFRKHPELEVIDGVVYKDTIEVSIENKYHLGLSQDQMVLLEEAIWDSTPIENKVWACAHRHDGGIPVEVDNALEIYFGDILVIVEGNTPYILEHTYINGDDTGYRNASNFIWELTCYYRSECEWGDIE